MPPMQFLFLPAHPHPSTYLPSCKQPATRHDLLALVDVHHSSRAHRFPQGQSLLPSEPADLARSEGSQPEPVIAVAGTQKLACH